MKRRNLRFNLPFRGIVCFVLFAFLMTIIIPTRVTYAQTLANLPSPGVIVPLSAHFASPILKGITIHPENPLQFDFIVDQGDVQLEGKAIEQEPRNLIRYFLASLTIPEKDLWVNLSPYERERIISDELGITEMGRDLLAQDYMLKQIMASLTYPEGGLGKEFWDRVYRKAYELYGRVDIPFNTFNKVWIVPEKAVVYEHKDTAWVVESRLKVMLEQDYLARQVNENQTSFEEEEGEGGEVSREIAREVLLPEIEKEVNFGKNFALLRQIYNSLILATWYKDRIMVGTDRDLSLLGQIYVDKGKVKGVDVEDKEIKQKIYEQYIEAFKEGVYDYIKEDYDEYMHKVIPRRYFSGGVAWENISRVWTRTEQIPEDAYQGRDNSMLTAVVQLKEAGSLLSDGEDNTLQDFSMLSSEENEGARVLRILEDHDWRFGDLGVNKELGMKRGESYYEFFKKVGLIEELREVVQKRLKENNWSINAVTGSFRLKYNNVILDLIDKLGIEKEELSPEEVKAILDEHGWRFGDPEVKKKLGIRRNQSYYEFFKKIGLLKELKEVLERRLYENNWSIKAVGRSFGVKSKNIITNLINKLEIKREGQSSKAVKAILDEHEWRFGDPEVKEKLGIKEGESYYVFFERVDLLKELKIVVEKRLQENDWHIEVVADSFGIMRRPMNRLIEDLDIGENKQSTEEVKAILAEHDWRFGDPEVKEILGIRIGYTIYSLFEKFDLLDELREVMEESLQENSWNINAVADRFGTNKGVINRLIAKLGILGYQRYEGVVAQSPTIWERIEKRIESLGVKRLYVDLDDTFFWTQGWVGSEDYYSERRQEIPNALGELRDQRSRITQAGYMRATDPQAVAVIKRLQESGVDQENGVKIIGLTARPAGSRKEVESIMSQLGVDFEVIYVGTQRATAKGERIRKENEKRGALETLFVDNTAANLEAAEDMEIEKLDVGYYRDNRHDRWKDPYWYLESAKGHITKGEMSVAQEALINVLELSSRVGLSNEQRIGLYNEVIDLIPSVDQSKTVDTTGLMRSLLRNGTDLLYQIQQERGDGESSEITDDFKNFLDRFFGYYFPANGKYMVEYYSDGLIQVEKVDEVGQMGPEYNFIMDETNVSAYLQGVFDQIAEQRPTKILVTDPATAPISSAIKAFLKEKGIEGITVEDFPTEKKAMAGFVKSYPLEGESVVVIGSTLFEETYEIVQTGLEEADVGQIEFFVGGMSYVEPKDDGNVRISFEIPGQFTGEFSSIPVPVGIRAVWQEAVVVERKEQQRRISSHRADKIREKRKAEEYFDKDMVGLLFGFDVFSRRLEGEENEYLKGRYQDILGETLKRHGLTGKVGVEELASFVSYGRLSVEDELSDEQKKKILGVFKEIFIRVLLETGEDLIKAAVLESFAREKESQGKESWPIPRFYDVEEGIWKDLNKIPREVDRYFRGKLLEYGLRVIVSPEEVKGLLSAEEYKEFGWDPIVWIREYYPQRDKRQHSQDEFSQAIVEFKEDLSQEKADEIISSLREEIQKAFTGIMKEMEVGEELVIVSIPSDKPETNQVDRLVTSMGKQLTEVMEGERQIVTSKDALKKQIITGKKQKYQVGFLARGKNITGMKGDKEQVKGKTVVIVDDIATTGSTLYEGMRAAYEAGAKKVIVMVLGKTTTAYKVERDLEDLDVDEQLEVYDEVPPVSVEAEEWSIEVGDKRLEFKPVKTKEELREYILRKGHRAIDRYGDQLLYEDLTLYWISDGDRAVGVLEVLKGEVPSTGERGLIINYLDLDYEELQGDKGVNAVGFVNAVTAEITRKAGEMGIDMVLLPWGIGVSETPEISEVLRNEGRYRFAPGLKNEVEIRGRLGAKEYERTGLLEERFPLVSRGSLRILWRRKTKEMEERIVPYQSRLEGIKPYLFDEYEKEIANSMEEYMENYGLEPAGGYLRFLERMERRQKFFKAEELVPEGWQNQFMEKREEINSWSAENKLAYQALEMYYLKLEMEDVDEIPRYPPGFFDGEEGRIRAKALIKYVIMEQGKIWDICGFRASTFYNAQLGAVWERAFGRDMLAIAETFYPGQYEETLDENSRLKPKPLTNNHIVLWKRGQLELAPGQQMELDIKEVSKHHGKALSLMVRDPSLEGYEGKSLAIPINYVNRIIEEGIETVNITTFIDVNGDLLLALFLPDDFAEWEKGNFAVDAVQIYGISEGKGIPVSPFILDLKRLSRGDTLMARPKKSPWRYSKRRLRLSISKMRGGEKKVAGYIHIGSDNSDFKLSLAVPPYQIMRLVDEGKISREIINNLLQGDKVRQGKDYEVGVYVTILEDPNHGLWVQGFHEDDFDVNDPDQSRNPLTTYGNISGKWRSVEPVIMDIIEFTKGRTDLRQLNRRIKRRVTKTNQILIKLEEESISFTLNDEEMKKYNLTYTSESPEDKFVELELREDPDYHPYVAIIGKREGKEEVIKTVIDTKKEQRRFISVDLAQKALVDHTVGKRNIHGQAIAPRIYHHPNPVPPDGRIVIKIGDSQIFINLTGWSYGPPTFVPEWNQQHGWILKVHDTQAYEADNDRSPDRILVKSPDAASWITLEKFESTYITEEERRRFEETLASIDLEAFLASIDEGVDKDIPPDLMEYIYLKYPGAVTWSKVNRLFDDWYDRVRSRRKASTDQIGGERKQDKEQVDEDETVAKEDKAKEEADKGSVSEAAVKSLTRVIMHEYYEAMIQNQERTLGVLEEKARTHSDPEWKAAYDKAYWSYFEDVTQPLKGIIRDPGEMELTLYQMQGVRFLLERSYALLADDPGLGKTLQAITAAINAERVDPSRPNTALVVVPAGLPVSVWKDEINKWTTEVHDIVIIDQNSGQGTMYKGGGEEAESITLDEVVRRYEETPPENMPFVIVTYDALKGNFGNLFRYLNSLAPEVFGNYGEFRETYQTYEYTKQELLEALNNKLTSSKQVIPEKEGKVKKELQRLVDQAYGTYESVRNLRANIT